MLPPICSARKRSSDPESKVNWRLESTFVLFSTLDVRVFQPCQLFKGLGFGGALSPWSWVSSSPPVNNIFLHAVMDFHLTRTVIAFRLAYSLIFLTVSVEVA